MNSISKPVQSSRGTYTAVYEQAEGGGWSGYTPELPIILATGRTLAEAEAQMRSAVEVWFEEMKSVGHG